jgi:hypothetical protein
VGGAGIPGGDPLSSPPPPAGRGRESSKAGRCGRPSPRRAAGEGAGRGRGGDAEGPSGPEHWRLGAPWGRPAGWRACVRAGGGQGGGAEPAGAAAEGGGGGAWEEGTSGGGADRGGAAEAPPPPPALKGAGPGWPGWAPGAEAGPGAPTASKLSQERSASPEKRRAEKCWGRAPETGGKIMRDVKTDRQRQGDKETQRGGDTKR